MVGQLIDVKSCNGISKVNTVNKQFYRVTIGALIRGLC